MASCDKAGMWPENRPDRLQDLCLYLLASDLSIIAQQRPPRHSFKMDNVSTSVDSGITEGEICLDPCDFGASSEVDPEVTRSYSLHPGICLPTQLADSLFTIITQQPNEVKEQRQCQKVEKLHVFSDKQTASLSQVDLRNIHEKSLVSLLTMLSSHPLIELTMPCVWRCLPLIKNIITLRSLRLEKEPQNNLVDAFIQGRPEDNAESIHELGSQVDGQPVFSADEEDFTLTCPNLRRLILHDLQFRSSGRLTQSPEFNSKVVRALLSPLQRLSHLSLSSCRVVLEDLDCLGSLTTLVWLNLANIHVEDFSKLITILQPLQRLQHLDLSHGDEEGNPLIYSRADGVVKTLMDSFPQLISLDLSGTNLAGFEPPETVSHRLVPTKQGESPKQVSKCSIPGLEGHHLEFLGLYGCAYSACRRQNIPATRVTGDADWSQVVLAVQVYVDNQLLLIKALNDLFNLFRYSTVVNHCLALEGVLAAMRAYPMDNSIQIAGSASLFYIAKGEHKQFITYHYKREMVHLLLVAMCQHSFDQTMMRNACLTLCHLNLPTDVMFCYERLVKQLLDMLKYDYRDEFIHRLGIFLLNCLACQVDGKEKELVGRLGAVETMLLIINRKLRLGECDDVLEVAWSTLWNVTDETPVNCEKFLNKGGMQLFVNCLQKFDKKPELLRNMMGLMGNIAEVDSLRKHLMTEEYVQIFSNLLESESDGIEVSYNACGVLSHICFDGAQAWKVKFPSRCYVMARMREAIKRWPLHSKRNINYRSFEPILRLVNHYETPVVQLWACWALCNLTTVSSEKYCRLLEREGGRATLERLIADPRPDKEIQDLALRTLRQLDAPLMEGTGGDQDMDGQEAESDDEDNVQQEQMEEGEDLGDDNGDGDPHSEDDEGSDVDDGLLWGQDPV